MSVCPNCGVKLGCGCQKRTAKDGTACCAKCVVSVNMKFEKEQKLKTEQIKTEKSPSIISATITKTFSPNLPK
jgi:hypothetical protein